MSDDADVQFQHDRLGSEHSTRLLDLLPASSRDAPVHCRLRPVSLQQAPVPKYEALSYVWGAPTGDCPITCNGESLLVTANCRAALVQLRRRFGTRTLWIDAVCIDQGLSAESIRERNAQVKMMGQIYAMARQVVVWLGEGDGSMAGTFRLLHVMGRLWGLQTSTKSEVLGTLGHFGATGINRFLCNNSGLPQLFSNPWFQRMWTIQEVVFARECLVVCGSASVPWAAFSEALWLPTNEYPQNAVWEAVPHAVGEAVAQSARARSKAKKLVDQRSRHAVSPLSTERPSLQATKDELSLLASIGLHKCTVPSDRVFGMYGILQAIGISVPDPDYTKSVLEVFEEATRCYMRSRKSLTSLVLAIRRGSQDSHDLPSWVIDWRQVNNLQGLGDETGIKQLGTRQREEYTASGRSEARVADRASGPLSSGRLTAKGKRMGRITVRKALGQERTARPAPGTLRRLREWCNIVAARASYPAGCTPREAFMHTLAFHFGYDWAGIRLDPATFDAWFDWFLGLSEPSIGPEHRTMAEFEAFRIVDYAVGDLTWYALVMLDLGYFGAVYHSCREGDEVFLLAGTHCPMVLRRHGDAHRFVAPAYVHGVMKGEAWPENEAELQEVTLV